ncbi:MAG: type I DNA topoisomerase [Calditerrivibrio sp.]|nr:type I DNA topoisomerase [Calditerrivibrio sp.]
MSKNLVIVESPSKAKTIEKYLGKDFKVAASMGHIKDLPEKEIGIDIENNFKPQYKLLKGKKKIVDEIKKLAQESKAVFLAPDPDREGEAIAWHIAEEIKNKNSNIYRVSFNEITEKGIKEGIKNPTQINIQRVNAQQSRRILDRLVGYQVSPLLWKPIKYGLSAGRVQTVALRLIVEREEEIEKFVPKEYWVINGFFKISDYEIKSKLEKIDGKKIDLSNEQEVLNILKHLEGKEGTVAKVEKKETKQAPYPPFITSTLQQEAIRKLGFTAKKTMMIAQQLYEGVEIGSQGPTGLITYMRTDSTRISEVARKDAIEYIQKNFGKEYTATSSRSQKSKNSNIQDAHEAIRPTNIFLTPDEVKPYLNNDQYKLYKLIWERFIASQMSDAIYEKTMIDIDVDKYTFRANGKVLIFPGFMKLYNESSEENDEEDLQTLPPVNNSDLAKPLRYEPKQHFTTPPPRYSEASLVKTLEQKGIGRPSTYATIISTIVERGYVELKEKRFYPTELGRFVAKLLIENFEHIFEVGFTAEMEKKLDEIEEGKLDWLDLLNEFYQSFKQELKKADENFIANLSTEINCPKCKKHNLNIKFGKNGFFLACAGYPECDFTSNFTRDENGRIILKESIGQLEETDIVCEKCGSKMVVKRSKFGEILTCPKYPECKNLKNFLRDKNGKIIVIEQGTPLEEKCPECHGDLQLKKGKNGLFIGCKNYPECSFTANFTLDGNGKIVIKAKPIVEEFDCNKCGSKMVLRKSKRGMFFACSAYPTCKNTVSAIKKEDGTITPKS